MTTPTATESCYQKYTTAGDRSVAHKLLTAILESNYQVAIYDGEEWTLNHSTSMKDIKDALATTGEDRIRVSDSDKKYVGSFHMIWENGDDDPICDYTANDATEKLYKAAQ